MENIQSPLQKYKRQPKLYIDLPSRGVWYNKNVIEKTEELEVYSMTASDEILAKTPDALITGNAVVKIIQNCVPAIKDAWVLNNRDFDYVLSAVRIATYGDAMNVGHKCKKCSNEDTFSFPLQRLLDHLNSVEPNYETVVDGFVFRLRPLTYRELVTNQQITMKVRRELYKISREEEKLNSRDRDGLLDQLYEEINSQTKEVICSIVSEITTPDGDKESNPIFIKDFLLNSEGKYFDAVQEVYSQNSEKLAIPRTDVQCSECGHESSVAPILDYTSFFLKP
jgi:hypothetical protein